MATYQRLEDTTVDIQDDFCYKNNVHNASKQARLNFIRKVYAILSVQVAITAGICGFTLSNESARKFVHGNIDLLPMLAISK